jgi:hypothetical protein
MHWHTQTQTLTLTLMLTLMLKLKLDIAGARASLKPLNLCLLLDHKRPLTTIPLDD